MNAMLTPETINILGGQENTNSVSDEGCSHMETKSEGFKSRVKKAWSAILNVARDIKEDILPIISTVGRVAAGLITAIAFFRNSKPRYAMC